MNAIIVEEDQMLDQTRNVFLDLVREFEGLSRQNLLTVSRGSGGMSICIGWDGAKHWQRNDDSTYFDCQIIGEVFYILSIQIGIRRRGEGIGDRLYERLTDAATQLGCREIRQTPSGRVWIGDAPGESRRDYLIRHGWTKDGNEVFRTIKTKGAS